MKYHLHACKALLILFAVSCAACSTDWQQAKRALVTADGIAQDYKDTVAQNDPSLQETIERIQAVIAGVIAAIDSGNAEVELVQVAVEQAYKLIYEQVKDNPKKLEKVNRVFFGVRASLRLAGVLVQEQSND